MARALFEDEAAHSGAEEEAEDAMEEDSDLSGFIVPDGSVEGEADEEEEEEAICRQQQQQQQPGEDGRDLGRASPAAARQLPAASVHLRLVGQRVNFRVMCEG